MRRGVLLVSEASAPVPRDVARCETCNAPLEPHEDVLCEECNAAMLDIFGSDSSSDGAR